MRWLDFSQRPEPHRGNSADRNTVYSIHPMTIAILGTIFAGLLGLAFGSFLNVCATRMPENESIVSPRSRCRTCGRSLPWYENIPLVSWMLLRGRCRGCDARIGWRYPLVELAVGLTWAMAAWQAMPAMLLPGWSSTSIFDAVLFAIEKMILCWLLILLAVLDAEHFWLPDRLTLGGAIFGLPFFFLNLAARWIWPFDPLENASGWYSKSSHIYTSVLHWIVGLLAVPLFLLFTRWAYRMVRQREGVGLGDAKLMLLIAVWLGLDHSLLAFVLGIFLGAVVAIVMLFRRPKGAGEESWSLTRLPLGTCLCVGGIVSALWGNELIHAYLEAAGFF